MKYGEMSIETNSKALPSKTDVFGKLQEGVVCMRINHDIIATILR
jgi:hypothetical protein